MINSSGSSSSQAHFSSIPGVKLNRSSFDRSCGNKFTANAGELIPFFLDEILPGDTVQASASILARLATPKVPYMDNVYYDVHFFFVPNRLVHAHWEKLMGAQDNPGDSISYFVPQFDKSEAPEVLGSGRINDFMGMPVVTSLGSISQVDMPTSLHARGYFLIWNTWYRDENIQNSIPIPLDDGPDTLADFGGLPDYVPLKRGRRKDYFTSALPWPQKGPSVTLPLGASAPVISNGNPIAFAIPSIGYAGHHPLIASGSGVVNMDAVQSSGTNQNLFLDNTDSGMMADLTSATASTINDMRQAIAVQQFYERDARGGTRYVELLLSHFGVVSPDFRLQRPEFLGGGTGFINVNPVTQTSATGATGTPQGNLSAFAVGRGVHSVSHSFVEHGYLFGFFSVRAENTYQQGMPKMFRRRARFDYYWPTFANLGEQAVLQEEIFYTDVTANNAVVFGYQERFAEYRYKPSYVSGIFRSIATLSLDYWHLAIDFGSAPALADLVIEAPPIDRVVAVTTQPQFIVDSYVKMKHTRAMPTYSVPGLSRL